ncbi:hypothetical protein Droror1_Dr00008362, partial [Drosera rotundifolia]
GLTEPCAPFSQRRRLGLPLSWSPPPSTPSPPDTTRDTASLSLHRPLPPRLPRHQPQPPPASSLPIAKQRIQPRAVVLLPRCLAATLCSRRPGSGIVPLGRGDEGFEPRSQGAALPIPSCRGASWCQDMPGRASALLWAGESFMGQPSWAGHLRNKCIGWGATP